MRGVVEGGRVGASGRAWAGRAAGCQPADEMAGREPFTETQAPAVTRHFMSRPALRPADERAGEDRPASAAPPRPSPTTPRTAPPHNHPT